MRIGGQVRPSSQALTRYPHQMVEVDDAEDLRLPSTDLPSKRNTGKRPMEGGSPSEEMAPKRARAGSSIAEILEAVTEEEGAVWVPRWDIWENIRTAWDSCTTSEFVRQGATPADKGYLENIDSNELATRVITGSLQATQHAVELASPVQDLCRELSEEKFRCQEAELESHAAGQEAEGLRMELGSQHLISKELEAELAKIKLELADAKGSVVSLEERLRISEEERSNLRRMAGALDGGLMSGTVRDEIDKHVAIGFEALPFEQAREVPISATQPEGNIEVVQGAAAKVVDRAIGGVGIGPARQVVDQAGANSFDSSSASTGTQAARDLD